MEGYKVFKPDWTCRGFQYEVGKTFEEDVTPSCCNYYPFNPDNKVAKVIALGEIDEESDDSKCCTNKIQIVEEISWEDVLRMVNLGKGNAGLCNSGNRNSGDWNSGNWNSGNRNSGNRNSGDWNSGNWNSGNWNSGNRNSGDWNSGNWNSGNRNSGNWNSGNRNSGNRNSGNRNSGDWNSGNWNSGNWNSGNRNSGNRNSGDWNSGNWNSGNWNSGNRNSGNRNSGDWNSGNWNSGNWNSGNRNSGNRNSGDWNSGNWNSGDWNKTNFSNGCFNTEEPKIFLFNKPSDWTYHDWLNSDARYLLNQIPRNVVDWIWSDDMTDEEKEQHPEYEVVGGYLKILDESECGQLWWDSLSERYKNIIKAMPNFDKEIFEDVTGIKI